MNPNLWFTSVIFKKAARSKEIAPIGENSPNLATLAPI
jgi:hypothetical protein